MTHYTPKNTGENCRFRELKRSLADAIAEKRLTDCLNLVGESGEAGIFLLACLQRELGGGDRV